MPDKPDKRVKHFMTPVVICTDNIIWLQRELDGETVLAFLHKETLKAA